jgi:hypothetical protein
LAAIALEWDESGATYAASGEGIFFIIAISGYIGSIIWGYAMLRASLTGRWVRTVSLVVGLTVIFFGFFPDGMPALRVRQSLMRVTLSVARGVSH